MILPILITAGMLFFGISSMGHFIYPRDKHQVMKSESEGCLIFHIHLLVG